MAGLINANPIIHERKARRREPSSNDENAVEEIDALEVFAQHLRDIRDPEHPYTLEQLNVLSEDGVVVDDKNSHVKITFTPTVQHCSMATLIGLCVRVKLLQCLPSRFKVDITLTPGSHSTELQGLLHINVDYLVLTCGNAVNKQLNDKERVAAAMENPYLSQTVHDCITGSLEGAD